MGSQPPGEVVSLLSVQRRSRYTLAGTFDTISHADGLAVPDRCFHSDTEAFIGIILEMRHVDGFGLVGSLLTAEEGRGTSLQSIYASSASTQPRNQVSIITNVRSERLLSKTLVYVLTERLSQPFSVYDSFS